MDCGILWILTSIPLYIWVQAVAILQFSKKFHKNLGILKYELLLDKDVIEKYKSHDEAEQDLKAKLKCSQRWFPFQPTAQVQWMWERARKSQHSTFDAKLDLTPLHHDWQELYLYIAQQGQDQPGHTGT